MPINRARYHFDNIYDTAHTAVGPYLLHQVGDLQCEPGYHIPPHHQSVHEITYIVAGRGVFLTDGVSYEVAKGTLFLNRMGEVHAITSSTVEPLRYFYLGFQFQQPVASAGLEKLQAFFLNLSRHVLPGASAVQEPFIRLLSEVITQDILSDSLIACAMHQIIACAYRLCSQRTYSDYALTDDARSVDEKLAYDVLHLLDSAPLGIGNLRSLCEVFGYSYTHIAQKFLKVTGETLRAYDTRRRFERAQERIRRGERITDVSEALGYQSIHAFSRAFKRQVGMTPSDYRAWAEENRLEEPKA